jgi:hypothetical protein
MLTAATEPVAANTEVALAPVPVVSVMVTVGAVVYPLLPVTEIAVITPPVTVAVALV